MQRKLFLFGTGKISQVYSEFIGKMSIDIEGYVDNDKTKWGSYFFGKQVCEPEILRQITHPCILIACAAKKEVSAQISQMNLEKYIISFKEIISFSSREIVNRACPTGSQTDIRSAETIIVDNLNGTWGGAEDWSHMVAASLLKRSYEVYVVEHTKQPSVFELKENIMSIDSDGKDIYYVYLKLVELLMKKKPFILFNVRNSELLWAAVAIKQIYPKEVRIISSILNDAIYEEFYEWDDSIDLYLCISSKILENMVKQHKLDNKKVYCRTPFIEKIRKVNKTYHIEDDEPLRIGYPCRLVHFQKRSDLIPELLMYLEEKEVNYVLNIAGDGPCEMMIKEYVEKNQLYKRVNLYGRLTRTGLFDFLDHQDVYLNFSEFEGTSLTMLEAMASGCVPVVTNVSGVSDFIMNEANGLIADVGDLEKISEYIAFLDRNRYKLVEYGERCMRIVQEKCNMDDYMDDIEKILKSI